MTIVPEAERRRLAAQATLDEFRDKPFKFGERDCVRMAAAHLRRLGYRVKLPAKGSYRTVRSARKALADRGFANICAAVDAHGLERIAPAAAVVGDIIAIPGEHDFGGALLVALGNGRCVGYHQDLVGAGVLQPIEYITAWRATPRR
ncbi:MAG: hypothetical protein KAY22_19350 [Rhizorhabdus sp.]|uniref:DUF6950 family protein n=1 Tax=Rhizorhabdus sp. TaxID=1968843 RepID=UPI001B755D56|nr:hypothetical protein [Rhizorhabdus sp.]MBP8234455.1 hypothetical protein [Rhizorhabdus sp.]